MVVRGIVGVLFTPHALFWSWFLLSISHTLILTSTAFPIDKADTILNPLLSIYAEDTNLFPPPPIRAGKPVRNAELAPAPPIATVIVTSPPTTSTIISTVEAFTTTTASATSETVPSSDSLNPSTGVDALDPTSASLHTLSEVGSTPSLSPTGLPGSSSSALAMSTELADQHGSTSSTSSPNRPRGLVAPIIGSIIGVLVAAILSVLLVRLRRRRRVNHYFEDIGKEGTSDHPPPYMEPVVPVSLAYPMDHLSSNMSTHGLAQSPFLDRSSDSPGPSPDGSLTGPLTSNSPDTYIPLHPQRRLQDPIKADGPPSLTVGELPPAYDAPRITIIPAPR